MAIISHDNALQTRAARVRTFSAAPTTGETARFQISAGRHHWRTLKDVTVPAGKTHVRTTWKAASHAEKRYFRLVIGTVKSNLVVIRVKAAQAQ